jgi:hypothetical protein
MIRHSVLFTLRHPRHSPQENDFLSACLDLLKIPGVTAFEVFRQTSPKNPFSLGLTMFFDDRETYEAYLNDPIHSEFVASRWLPEVLDFLEIDSEAISLPAPHTQGALSHS